MKIGVIIPAYKPTEQMLELLDRLNENNYSEIIIIDDGSGEQYSHIFEKAVQKGHTLLVHEENKGKGKALKTALEYCLNSSLDAVITADADGQHTAFDIKKMAEAIIKNPEKLILGCRKFDCDVPFKSKFGNVLTRAIFYAAGVRVSDTQTGLRAFSKEHIKWMLEIEGDRYEYETAILLIASKKHVQFFEVDIATVYLDNNEGSHFNPLRDGYQIYKQIIKFASSSLLAFGVDFLIFWILQMNFPEQLFLSVLIARAISSVINFTINKQMVFGSKGLMKSILSYYALVAVLMIANYFLILALVTINVSTMTAKVIVEAILFLVSYFAQKALVFAKSKV